VGLSAIQVGTPARIFMTYLPPLNDLDTLDDQQPPQELKIFINPEIIDKSEKVTLGPDKKHPALEGCLSIPNLYGPVPRHQTIKIKYQTIAGSLDREIVASNETTKRSDDQTIKLIEKTEVFSNFYARVIQHEFDHLEGILFTDYTLKHGLPLYFDNGKTLTEIPLPEKLIQW
jgi:peptide deformylase